MDMTLFGDDGVTQIVKRDDGFYWPADDTWCHKVIHSEVSDSDAAVALCKGKNLALQAGGNVGVWAAHLARQFTQIVTAEPDATNYECLKRNIPANVLPWRAGLGAEPGSIGMTLVPGNAGAHYLGGSGDIPIITIDSLGLPTCDFLCLDVEGSEPAALRGAEQTIRKYKPVIMFEEKGLSERYYGIKRDTAEKWVLGLGVGYRTVSKIRADVLMAVG